MARDSLPSGISGYVVFVDVGILVAVSISYIPSSFDPSKYHVHILAARMHRHVARNGTHNWAG